MYSYFFRFIMKLIDIFNDPDFNISENPIKVKKNIIDILGKHSYACHISSKAIISNIATYIAKRKKKYKCNKQKFKSKELDFLERNTIPIQVPEVYEENETNQQVCQITLLCGIKIFYIV